jgi:hypothetical protein
MMNGGRMEMPRSFESLRMSGGCAGAGDGGYFAF